MNAVLQSQHEEAKARKAKFFPQCRAMPVMMVRSPVEPLPLMRDAHVLAYRRDVPLRARAPVVRAVSIETGVHIRDIMGRAQFAFCARARQIAMYVLVTDVGMGYAATGRYFGRDHTTVMHAVKAVGGRLQGDAGLRAVVGAVRREIGIPA